MPDAPEPAKKKTKKNRWRPWVRALHRDAGYFVIGLTVIYALSGLAVNHIGDWDPSFHQVERTHQVAAPLPADDDEAAAKVLAELQRKDEPEEVYRDEDELSILIGETTLTVDTKTGKVLEQGQQPRFFLRVANWLHLNRGKKAWTYFADGYAVLLLFLALSGPFMLPGRKGFFGRGAIITTMGAALPVGYLVWFGGP